MPKDEFDPEDPMELVGVGGPAVDDREMVLAVVDEYVRMGFSADEIIALFRDPCYSMTHRIWMENGEDYVRACVGLVVARWSAGSSTVATAGGE